MTCKEKLCFNNFSIPCDLAKSHEGLHESQHQPFGRIQWGLFDHSSETPDYMITHARLMIRMEKELDAYQKYLTARKIGYVALGFAIAALIFVAGSVLL